ncbi:BgTH12-01241 [Blumeria graminis f. sp. triticale]|uniref:BgTH12-01241 n=1 Tax=Blumeria graminis f. sp. triticale TaxID=1689686 RepID=A0A9W4DPT2_BLUGR|nr:BgTH12-01241 [Blumeria graminis f. sp. triticale]
MPVLTVLVTLPWLFPTRCARQFSNYTTECSVAPTTLQPVAKALYCFDVLHTVSVTLCVSS